MHYQWNDSYQAIPDPRMPIMLQTWHQERGCPWPRPRSYSLNALASNTSTIDLSEVSSIKSPWSKNAPTPPGPEDRHMHSNHRRPTGKNCRANFCYLVALLIAIGLTLVGLAALRSRLLTRAPVIPNDARIKVHSPDLRAHSPLNRGQQPPGPNFNHPSPPQPFAGSPIYYKQAQSKQQLPYQQYVQPSLKQLQFPPEGFVYHYNPQHGHSYAYSPVMYNMQQAKLQPYKQPQLQPKDSRNSFSWVDQSDIVHHGGVPAWKPWMFEHVEAHKEQDHNRHQQASHINQQNHQPTKQTPKPHLSRHEEREKIRNEARSSQSSKNASRNVDDIWEEELKHNKSLAQDNEMPNLKLVIEPAVSPYRVYANTSDGKIVLKSYEDDEDITIEIVVEE